MLESAALAFAVLAILLTIGVPLPYCFAGGIITMVALGDATMRGAMLYGFGQLASPVLLAIPLFVLAGTIMSSSGIAAALLRLVNDFVGGVRGGLGVVATISCAIIGAISGSGLTGVAAVGPILIPEMENRGYPRGYAAALIANSSVLGLLIPPSVTMIIFGWVTNTSILASFLATLGPGLLVTLLLCLVNLRMARKFPLVLDEPSSFQDKLKKSSRNFVIALPALFMPVLILGGIYGGIMTPTEAAAVAVVYAIPVGFIIYRGLTLKSLLESGKEAGTSVGSIMIMILFSLILSQMFVFINVPQKLVGMVFQLTENKTVLLLMICGLLFILGMIVNDITAIILVAPLLMPLMDALQVSAVQFAAIIGVNTALGGVTPPYASILYLAARVGNVSFIHIIRPAMALLFLCYIPVALLTAFWPGLSTTIPRLLGY